MHLFRVMLATLLAALAATGTAYAQEVFPHSSVLPLLIYETQNEAKVLVATGSGFVVQGKERYLVTAKHNTYAGEDNNPTTLFALIESTPCALSTLWAHKTADVVLMRFHCDAQLLARLTPLSISTQVPLPTERMTLYGFQLPHRIFGEKRCRRFERVHLCERIAYAHLRHVNASTKDFASVTAEREAKMLAEAQKKDPKVTYDDLYYSTYITAGHPKVRPEELYTGTSGGALVDQYGRVAGVMMGETLAYLVFIPIRELPKEFF